MTRAILSIDGACSGKRAACAAVLSIDGKTVAESSRRLPEVDGYVLAAEIAGVALGGELLGQETGLHEVIVETDNPDVARVLEGGYRPPQLARIPCVILEAAGRLCRSHRVVFRLRPRNSTPGLRKADRLAGERLLRRRSSARHRAPR